MRFNQPEFSGNTSLETHLWPASARRQTKLISQVRPPCQQLCISWSWPWLRRVFPGFLPARSLTRQTSARRLTDRGVRVLMFRASFPRSWALSAGRIDAGESGKGNSTPSLSLSLCVIQFLKFNSWNGSASWIISSGWKLELFVATIPRRNNRLLCSELEFGLKRWQGSFAVPAVLLSNFRKFGSLRLKLVCVCSSRWFTVTGTRGER